MVTTLLGAIETRLLEIRQRKEQEALVRQLQAEELVKENGRFIDALLSRINLETGIVWQTDDLHLITLIHRGQGMYHFGIKVPYRYGERQREGYVNPAHEQPWGDTDHMTAEGLMDTDMPINWNATHRVGEYDESFYTTDLVAALAFAYSGER